MVNAIFPNYFLFFPRLFIIAITMKRFKSTNQTVTEATRLMKARHYREAIALLEPHVHPDQNKMWVWGILANAYIKTRQSAKAIALLKPLHDSGRGDTVTTNTLGNAYLHGGNPSAAIALLKPLQDSGRGSTFTTATLGNAYLHGGNPFAAIALLKPLHDSGRGDTVTANTLGNAFTIVRDRRNFDAMKDKITPAVLKDYLDAKLCYFEGRINEALNIVQPYMQGDIHTAPQNIVQIFMACTPDESPVLAFMKSTVGANIFSRLKAHRDSWRQDPLRAEFQDTKISNSNTVFELGANPVSHADRAKAGLGRETRVAARPAPAVHR